MDPLAIFHALILGVVEGLTEFLPVSSTGHLILASDLLGVNDAKGKTFEVVIQTGAMLAIVWEYRRKFIALLWGVGGDPASRRFVANLVIAFLPAAAVGLAFGGLIKLHLFAPVPVALAFVLGALVIFWVERRPIRPRIETVDEMTWRDALKVGLAQCFALIPGTSRSGATIIGGMLFGLSRKAATEFSFFLAVPTLIAAGAYDLYKNSGLFVGADLGALLTGIVSAFVSAFLCVRWFLRYVAHHDFRPFAWYRLAFGVAVLLSSYFGWVDWSVP